MSDEVDLGLGDAVNVLEEGSGLFGHHHDAGGQIRQTHQDAPLIGAGDVQNRVQGRDDRHPQVAEQAKKVTAGRTAVNPVLMLDADDIRVGEVEIIGCPQVAVQVLLVDLEPDLRRIVVSLRAIVDRNHEALGVWELARHRRMHVVCKRRDAALSGKIIPHERNLLDFGVSHGRDARLGLAGLTPKDQSAQAFNPAIPSRYHARYRAANFPDSILSQRGCFPFQGTTSGIAREQECGRPTLIPNSREANPRGSAWMTVAGG